MLDQEVQELQGTPVIVTLPGQIDLTSQERAYDRLYAAFASGAPVVVADFSATTFCDCSSLRRLMTIQRRAAARGAQLRLAIPPDGPVRRVAQLMDVDHLLPVFSSVREAAAGTPPRLDARGSSRRAAGRTAAMAGIIDLIGASHLHISRWQERLGQLRRQGGDRVSHPELAAAWDTLAALIDLHMRADDEICGLPIYGTALARELRDAHEGIREIIDEASLQPHGSPLWWDLTAAILSAWTRQCDYEEHGIPAGYRRRADPALRHQLGRQWRAFREAHLRDRTYPQAPPQLPTCQLRLSHPAPPRLADPAFSPLACTCRDCTGLLDRVA